VVYGIDFTSAPSKRKPITCARAYLDENCLTVEALDAWQTWGGFEALLQRPGPWIAGLDFPFGLPQKFIRNIGWPPPWADYVRHIESIGKTDFEAALNDYRLGRAAGDREHLRATDRPVGAISPQKLYGVPVAKMLFAGAPRLLNASVDVWPLRIGANDATVIEAYPGYLVRRLCGRISYKHDQPISDAVERQENRQRILSKLKPSKLIHAWGRLKVVIEKDVRERCTNDHRGDCLDAVLSAVHAAMFALNPVDPTSLPQDATVTEGWIPTIDT